MLKICVCGATGRMGISIVTCANQDPELTISAAVEYAGHPSIGQPFNTDSENPIELTADLKEACLKSDVVIDFALASGIEERIKIYAETKTPLVLGTTAVDQKGLMALEELSKVAPVLHASNFSIGVNLLFNLTKFASKILGAENFDAEIIEVHHKRKIDSPSGTAITLVEKIEEGRQIEAKKNRVYGREGLCGARPVGEIGIHAVRGGDVVGEHTVIFASEGERVELTHKASNRNNFAQGSLQAAKFLIGKLPKSYSMNDLLGLN